MDNFSEIEETLFVPMIGRIYAGEHFPNILYDEKALSIKDSLPKNIKSLETYTEYTFLAGAVRSINFE